MYFQPLLIIIILLIIFLWGIPSTITTFFGAPWLPTKKSSILKMLKLANPKRGDLVYDLGSGNGRILLAAVKKYGVKAVGIEIDPIKCIIAKILIRLNGQKENITIINGNFFQKNLSNADIIFCYLLQKTNKKLMGKLKKELKPGAKIVSNSFTFPRWKIIKKDPDKYLYLYIAGKSYQK